MGMMNDVAAAHEATLSGLAFEDLFVEQRDRLFAAMWLVARDRHEAEDLTQEAFVRVWERWDQSGAPDDPAGYLYRTAMNLFLNRRRRAGTTARRMLHLEADVRDTDDEIDRVELRDEIRRALRTLTPAQRAALVLVDLLDLSSDEAAHVLRKRPSTVRVLAARGRASLAQELGGIDA
jgi:RNA polymerase sigma-70 factor (ECF subfamily)